MRVISIYKDKTDYSRTVDEFLRDFERQTGHVIEVIDPDSADGAQFCESYDITEYPTLIALADDGTMQNIWPGLPLPTMNEVSYYAQQN